MIEVTTARVISTPTYDDTVNGYTVEVTTPTFQADNAAPQTAIIVPAAHGSVALPSEGARVLVVELPRRAYVLGAFPHENDGQPRVGAKQGERVIGTSGSEARIRLTPSGDVNIISDDTIDSTPSRVTLTANGQVIINGGDTRPITDVTTDTDADGHVTNVSVSRADDVFI